MSRIPETRAEIDAADRYQSYRRGWRDGATSRVRAAVFETHTDQGIRAAYDLGYIDGQRSYGHAMIEAQRLYKHTPSVLRNGPPVLTDDDRWP
jgi:hypothetical protein